MKVIVFDLDDTLYDEMTYVVSGLKAVSHYLEQEREIPANESYERMCRVLAEQGRGKIFDEVLASYQLRSNRLVRECLQVYRNHKPKIKLYDDAERCLERMSHHPMYIVTDGNKHVQLEKLKTLGLYDHPHIRKCYITRRYGIHNEKPSPYCFSQISKIEKVDPDRIVYIGDNPNKDFVGIKPLGFQTVRILRGSHAHVRKSREYEADIEIASLDEFVEG